ncbi:serine protease, partial [Cupriavidus gilardii J11]
MPFASRIHTRLASRTLGAAVSLCTLLGATPTLSAAADAASSAAPAYTGNIIVRWRDTQQPTAAPLRQLAEKTGVGLTVKRTMSGNAELVSITGGGAIDPEALAARLREDPRVADAVPDRWLRLHDTVPNDPLFPNQPYLASPSTVPGGANLPAAWDRSRGSASMVIAVIDTGVLRHGDLAARLINGYDFISDPQYSLDGDGREADPTDAGDNVPSGYTCPGSPPAQADQPNSWHGTRVASVLGATTDNNNAIAGVNWQARILPVRVSGRCGAQLSDTIDGMRWAGG